MAETSVALGGSAWQKQGIFTMAETGVALGGSVAETGDFYYGRNRGDSSWLPWQKQEIFTVAETGVALGGSRGRNSGC